MKRDGNFAQWLIGIIFTILGTIFVGISVLLFLYEMRSPIGTELFGHLMSFIFCVIGIPFLLIGIGFLVYCVRKKKQKQKLLETGKQIRAAVTGYEINYNVSVNGRHPIRLNCEYRDPYTGSVILYRSGNCWNPGEGYVGQSAAIYVDSGNPRKYYVDIDSIPLYGGANVIDYR
ncbi:MAG: DUF3592 domain-containing protein [Eubacteriales bacterium]|nr:DUF3592 domain-containing protein [Eubacteriales bacterium]